MNAVVEEKKKSHDNPRKDLNYIRVDNMQPSPLLNIREDLGELEEMILTIIESPSKIPALTGHTKNRIKYITDGHRRLTAGKIAQDRIRAAKLNPNEAFMSFTPAQIRELPDEVVLLFSPEPLTYTDVDRLTDMFILNEGKRLTLMEHAKGIKRFIDDFDLTPKEIAHKLHKSVTYINNCLSLLKAPDELKKHISDGMVSATLVRDLMKTMPIEEVSRVVTDTIESKSKQPKQLLLTTDEFASPADSQDRPERISKSGDDDDSDDDIGFLIVEDEDSDRFRNSDGGGIIKPLPVRITKKDIIDQTEKFNSIGAFKAMIRRYPDVVFNQRKERLEEFVFFQRVLDGEVDAYEMWNRFFDVSTPEALKDELSS